MSCYLRENAMATKLRRVKQKIGNWRKEYIAAKAERRRLKKLLDEAVEILRMATANGYGLGHFGVRRDEFVKRHDAASNRLSTQDK